VFNGELLAGAVNTHRVNVPFRGIIIGVFLHKKSGPGKAIIELEPALNHILVGHLKTPEVGAVQAS
jgi:hypothetical protein